MTSREFAAAVSTPPTVAQRSIEAKLREMVGKRLDEAPAPQSGRCELMDILDGD